MAAHLRRHGAHHTGRVQPAVGPARHRARQIALVDLTYTDRAKPPAPIATYDYDPDADRKLLLHAWQINSLAAKVEQKGLSIVPLKLYFAKGHVKVEIALARGKKLYDQRETLKRDAENRDAARELARFK